MKWKLYALLALAFIAGLFGLRQVVINSALDREKARVNEQKLKSIKAKKEIERDVKTQDDDSLTDRLTRP